MQYGTLMIVDSEDEFRQEEVEKLRVDVTEKGLSVLVLAEWYEEDVMRKIKFFDDNTQMYWTPQTGGGHVPGLNTLLAPYGVALGAGAFKGAFSAPGHSANIKSGSAIARWPQGGYLYTQSMQDEGHQMLKSLSRKVDIGVLGLLAVGGLQPGRLAVFTDSSCVDGKESDMSCWWVVEGMLAYTSRADRPSHMIVNPISQPWSPADFAQLPLTNPEFQLHLYSRATGVAPQCRALRHAYGQTAPAQAQAAVGGGNASPPHAGAAGVAAAGVRAEGGGDAGGGAGRVASQLPSASASLTVGGAGGAVGGAGTGAAGHTAETLLPLAPQNAGAPAGKPAVAPGPGETHAGYAPAVLSAMARLGPPPDFVGAPIEPDILGGVAVRWEKRLGLGPGATQRLLQLGAPVHSSPSPTPSPPKRASRSRARMPRA